MSAQHAVIVGGSSGIGLATAERLLHAGFKVTISGRSESKLSAAKASLKGDVETLVMDASNAAQIKEAFAMAGAFDHLVLALGSGKGLGPFATQSIDELRQGFEEKAIAQYACAQAALPSLAKDGSITFIEAVSAHAAWAGISGIGAVNASIASLIPNLAVELKPLRVNAVSPGVTDTPWWDFLSEDQKSAVFAEYAGKSLAGRVGKPDDIAKAIAFLIDNTFMTGQTIICDGGLVLG
jgi:NAD(P)-dependent dehydrogenase (short-subunit alcohol dehydrogenase family)